MNEATIENIAGVKEVKFEKPPGGGVVVFRGQNGAGKSCALEALKVAIGESDGKLQVRDGAETGRVKIGGVTLTVGRNKRRRGELEFAVSPMPDGVSILVNPGIADPKRADAARLKALSKLCGAQADESAFESLAQGTGMSTDSLLTGADRTDLADCVKRFSLNAQAAARQYELDVAEDEGSLAVLQAELAELPEADTDARADDLDALREKKKASDRAIAQCEAKIEEAEESERERAKAMEELEGFDVQSLQADHHALSTEVDELNDRIAKLEAQRDKAKEHLANVNVRLQAAEAFQKAAEKEVRSPKLKEELANRQAESEQLDAQIKAAESAGKRLELQQKIGTLSGSKEQALLSANRLRTAAKSTEDVLKSALKSDRFRWREDRLYFVHPDGREELFDRLSHGQKAKQAVMLKIQSIGDRGIMTLDQEFWEGLDPTAKSEIVAMSKEHDVDIITCEATDEQDLCVYVME